MSLQWFIGGFLARLRVSFVILLLVFFLSACNKKEEAPILRLSQQYNLYSMDPDRAADAQSRAILSNFYEPLVAFDRDLKIGPALATNWSEPDELTWIFELRKGVKFHDGHTLTASDVKASFERVGGPGVYDPVIGISAIDAIDALHVRFRLAHPSPLLLNRLTQVLIVPEKLAWTNIEQPIGTGPYKFVQRSENELLMEAFQEHWSGTPGIQRVHFAALPASSFVDARAANKIDVYRLLPPSVEKHFGAGVGVSGRSGLAMMFLWFHCGEVLNGEKNPFSDVRVRRAISLALDRNRIVQDLGGRDTPSNQLIPDGVFGFMPQQEKLPHDSEAARKLIHEAGYPHGFETTLTHPPGEAYAQLVQIVAKMLAPIGIKIRSRELEFVKFLEARGAQKLPFFALTWTFDDGDAWTFLMASLHTKAGPADFRSTNPGYSNLEMDRMIQESQQAKNIHDTSERYQAILNMSLSELPIIPLYRRYDLYGVSERVRFHPRLDGKLLAAEIELAQ